MKRVNPEEVNRLIENINNCLDDPHRTRYDALLAGIYYGRLCELIDIAIHNDEIAVAKLAINYRETNVYRKILIALSD